MILNLEVKLGIASLFNEHDNEKTTKFENSLICEAVIASLAISKDHLVQSCSMSSL